MKRSQNSEQNLDERWNKVKTQLTNQLKYLKKKTHPTVITHGRAK